MGLKLCKSFKGGVFSVFRLSYSTVSIKWKTDLELLRE